MGNTIMPKYSLLGGIGLLVVFIVVCLFVGAVLGGFFSETNKSESSAYVAGKHIVEFSITTMNCSSQGISTSFSETQCEKERCYFWVTNDEVVRKRCEIIEEAP